MDLEPERPCFHDLMRELGDCLHQRRVPRAARRKAQCFERLENVPPPLTL